MVWQSVELQDIKATGAIFRGYGLKDLMEFSGNVSDKASVTFEHEAAETKEVEVQWGVLRRTVLTINRWAKRIPCNRSFSAINIHLD